MRVARHAEPRPPKLVMIAGTPIPQRTWSAARVAVTGVGLVTALGADANTTWQGLVAGRSGLRRVAGYDPTDEKVAVAGEVEIGRAHV